MANHTVINDITNYAEAGPNSLEGVSTQKFRVSESTLKILQWLCYYFDNMAELRKSWKRAQDFVMGGEDRVERTEDYYPPVYGNAGYADTGI